MDAEWLQLVLAGRGEREVAVRRDASRGTDGVLRAGGRPSGGGRAEVEVCYPETVSTFVSADSVREVSAGDSDGLVPASAGAASPDEVQAEGASEAERR